LTCTILFLLDLPVFFIIYILHHRRPMEFNDIRKSHAMSDPFLLLLFPVLLTVVFFGEFLPLQVQTWGKNLVPSGSSLEIQQYCDFQSRWPQNLGRNACKKTRLSSPLWQCSVLLFILWSRSPLPSLIRVPSQVFFCRVNGEACFSLLARPFIGSSVRFEPLLSHFFFHK